MNQLNVFFNSIKVGELKRDSNLIYSFQYSDEWLKYEECFPLSFSLPIQKKIYGNKETLSFFENLLPEGDVKHSLEKSQNVEGVFDFLNHYGQDCAGAITITADTSAHLKSGTQHRVLFDIEQIYDVLSEKKSIVELIAEKNPGYLSLAGAQDKFPAIYLNQKIYLPKFGAPTTHIIKMPIFRSNIKNSVYSELFCMQLAKIIGFDVPDCFVHPGKYPLFVVKRYDRTTDQNGNIIRLHQQDFCQAQGLTSEFKYEEKGGPSIQDNYNVILQHVSGKKRLEVLQAFLDWVAFNLLIGNNDSHSKNISLLRVGNRYEMAPMYDLICTSIYPKLKNKFAFQIGDRTDYSKIGKNQFLMLDSILNLKSGTFQERFQNIHDLISLHKENVIDQIEKKHGEVKLLHRISDHIDERAKSFRKQKGLG